ncbi:MFS transporter [Pedobacter helvus]|uniref:MFS transporter n=1 Tax=Pedobacter helvus TaxID=2563444 RepID=A0ABW9JGL0_9SPHI|nr:MFS transporter [Pedobacter ureilyticus]
MLNKLFSFYRPSSAIAETQLNEEERNKYLKRLRWSVFLSATFGYGLYYVCRLCLNVIKNPLVKSGVLTESELGIIGSALFFSYAIGKFVNGFLADRVNIRRFMATGLFISALSCIALGFTTSFVVFTVLWGVNGWAQSMGAPPSVIALTRWYSPQKRGTFYGFWSASHNIGESITFIVISLIVASLGWQWGFWGASIFGMIGVIVIYSFLHEHPEAKGLYLAEHQQVKKDESSVSSQQLQVLKNPYIWILALASSFMYVSRYAINSWGVFFLETGKGYNTVEASSIISVSSVCGILGTISSGFISDSFFKGSRNLPALIFGMLNAASIAVFLYVPKGNLWVDIACMVLFGLSIGVLVCYLGGLMAVDIASKKASGAALGVVGVASYIGAGLQDIISGHLIEKGKYVVGGKVNYNFETVNAFWIGAAVISFLLAALVWNASKKKPAN